METRPGSAEPSFSSWTRVELARSGGMVPTLRPHFEIELSQLPAAERATVTGLLNASNFLALPARFSSATLPDAYTYRLTAWNAAGPHSIEFSDGDGHPDALDTLLNWLQTHKP